MISMIGDWVRRLRGAIMRPPTASDTRKQSDELSERADVAVKQVRDVTGKANRFLIELAHSEAVADGSLRRVRRGHQV